MNQSKTFKLIVQVSDNCLDLLRYIDKNISDINSLGVRLHVEKIAKSECDDEMIENLRKHGITRLPALISPDNKIFIGIACITNLFEKNLNNIRTGQRVGPIKEGFNQSATSAEIGSNPDMTDYWMRELYSGTDENGKLKPRDDPDEAEDESKDYEKKMRDQQKNQPKQRRQGSDRERDVEPAPRTRRRNYEESDDNIADSDDEYIPTRRSNKMPELPSTGDASGDNMDDRMLAAWMENNPHE